ncbi:hypothetical protein [Mycolicibacterium sp. 050158]|uniref:hypothetical protein n=1 Tax=Mycolicibacterium sp. 050158 TaxID=3090602 RepID=UPI00299D42EF|nr:hypothetical protein [Mycolicibacterium sp. 050158]MDX1892696.1 hypothetical protein [Mycolicibacterium sp. 050158]
MTTTTWVAVAAFCISLSTLIANVALTWLKWPRIVVEVAARHDGASDEDASDLLRHFAGEVFLLTVVNNGSEPVTVKSVGLVAAGPAAHRVDYLHTWRGPSTERLPRAHGVEELVMPWRITGHECHVFEYGTDILDELPRGVLYRGYATRYQAFRLWPNHPLVRETRSKQTVTRRYRD